MASPSLASALTLSTVGLASRSFLRLTTKEFKVEGLPTLLDALSIPHGDKSKGKMSNVGDGSDPSLKPRRGILTSTYRAELHYSQLMSIPLFHSMQP